MLIETNQYLVLIRFLILVSNLTFLDFVFFGNFLSNNIYLENGIFKICFRQSAKCKMTTQTGRKYNVFLQNLQFRMYVAIKTSIFELRPLLRFLCLINSFYRRYVCCIHNRSNGSNGSPLFFTISPLFFIISPLFLHYFSLFLVIHPLFHITLTILCLHSHVCNFQTLK